MLKQFFTLFNLKRTIDSDIYQEAKIGFKQILTSLESYISKDDLEDIPDTINFSLGTTKKESKYRKWCLENQLFLNPLNDIVVENIASHDCLFLPTMN